MVNIPGTRLVLLQKTGRRKVIWKYLSSDGQKVSLTDSPGTVFQIYSNGSGVVLGLKNSRQSKWLTFVDNPEEPFQLTESLDSATNINPNTIYPASRSGNTLQIEVSDLPSEAQTALANTGSFGFLLSLNEPTKADQFIGTGTLDPNLTTQTECEATNGYWDETQLACFTCVSGRTYPDRVNLTCLDCPSGSNCGDKNGYCDGNTNNPEVVCLEDPVSKTYAPDCYEGAPCGGQCSGNCRGKVFGVTCQNVEGIYQCRFDRSKWWIILLWAIFFVVILALFIFFFVWLFRRKKVTNVIVQQPIQQPIQQPVQQPIQPVSRPVNIVQPPQEPSTVVLQPPKPQTIVVQSPPAEQPMINIVRPTVAESVRYFA